MSDRRAFLQTVLCAFAVASIPCTVRADDDVAKDDWPRPRQRPDGLKFVDALDSPQPTFWAGDLVMYSDYAGGGFAGCVGGYMFNPWKKTRRGEGDFVYVVRSPPYHGEWRVSSSIRHATYDDLKVIGHSL